MSQSATTETTEEFLARGGEIQKIERGVSGDAALRFNRPLKERIKSQKAKTYAAARKRLQK